MSVISKVQAAVASASQETTLALANANFDFSLIKVEAPPEYQGLGSALTKIKRSAAEDGPAHTTARRLGTLFQSILPSTPNLIRAYGQRATEIAESPAVNPKGTAEEHGPFQDYVGVDGTSIWAAATSGSPAIAAHLLACMIACFWKADEATAIWVELVAERKHLLEAKCSSDADGYFDLREAVASRCVIDQQQLAEWDASARAWLAAANDAPAVAERQQRLRAHANRLNASVSSHRDVYTSVTEAWILSLETLERLLCGTSYSIEDGSVLLALLSWHLYPDLIVVDPQNRVIPQDDVLFEAGGSVTIGLSTRSIQQQLPGDNRDKGVRWSLSLGHLRFYGAKTTTTRTLSSTLPGNSRFTWDEFVIVFLGSIIGNWPPEEIEPLDRALDFISLVTSKIEETVSKEFGAEEAEGILEDSWVRILRRLMRVFDSESRSQRDEAFRLLRLGIRHPKFTTPTRGDPHSYHFEQRDWQSLRLNTLEFVKVIRESQRQNEILTGKLARFQSLPPPWRGQLPDPCYFLILIPKSEESGQPAVFYSRQSDVSGWKKPQYEGVFGGPYTIPASNFVRHDSTRKHRGFAFGKYDETKDYMIATHGPIIPISGRISVPIGSMDETAKMLRGEELDAMKLLEFINSNRYFWLLRVISGGSAIYKSIPGATIAPEVLLSSQLYAIAAQTTGGPLDFSLRKEVLKHGTDRAGAFRLLTFLETGHDIGPLAGPAPIGSHWNRVIAVSTEDTLYVNPNVMGSPGTAAVGPLELRRIRGNVGRPGLTIIGWFSNYALEFRKPDPTKWQIVNHNTFNGDLEDCFSSTSLHIQFTGYSEVIDFGAHNRVSNGALVEAVVSAYDRIDWLGDLNMWQSPPWSEKLQVVSRLPECPGDSFRKPINQELVTIENWEELLSPHHATPGVIQCHGNWQARLAASSLCVQRGYLTLLFQDHGCWFCAFENLEKMKLRWNSLFVTAPTHSDEETSDDESVSSGETPETAQSAGGSVNDEAGVDEEEEESSSEDDDVIASQARSPVLNIPPEKPSWADLRTTPVVFIL
ncbi:hypothetical protein F4778DRAFT_707184 [Xylariomycetidae sp. FL2044]|nr:hypothetical protein F4778DRAFT_707184 [Xylariomycetidae sp. FL2044]